jgi:hypothetical protein
MKTGNKILFTIAVLILVAIMIGLMTVRKDLQLMVSKERLQNKYKTMKVGNFDKLDFSSNWDVKIFQGKEFQVKIKIDEAAVLKPMLENIAGTLYLKAEAISGKEYTGSLLAKITVPSLKMIKAVQGTKIQLENFQSDSLNILLENAGAFTGKNNDFKNISFKIAGDTRLQFMKDAWR